MVPELSAPLTLSCPTGPWTERRAGERRINSGKRKENLGSKMINEVVFSVGGQVINRYSGDYLLAQVQRDFSQDKKDLFDKMTGNATELNDPANFGGRVNVYPSAYNYDDTS